MSMLFESMMANDESQRVASRKALALAKRRSDLQFGRFLSVSRNSAEVEARLSLIEDDLQKTVLGACEECDFPNVERVLDSVRSSLQAYAGICPDCDGEGCAHCTKESTVRESRRPKMCPYHREVTDISLASGDSTAGFNAMSGSAFGDQSCRGGYGGNCNWKPEMVTQSYWDDRAKQLEERRQDRHQQQLQQQPQTEFEAPELVADDLNWDLPEEGGIDDQLAEAPSAVGQPEMAMAASSRTAALVEQPLIHGGSLMPLGMIAQKKPGLTLDGQPYESWSQTIPPGPPGSHPPVEVNHPNPKWAQIAADILAQGHDGPLKAALQAAREQREQAPVPGQMPVGPPQPGPAMASHQAGGHASDCECGFCKNKGKLPGQSDEEDSEDDDIEKDSSWQIVISEALETVDVTKGGETGSPKMDKRDWTPENVRFLDDLDSKDGPHPTIEQDIQESPEYKGSPFKDDGRFEQTDAVTEKQKVDMDIPTKTKANPTKTFPKGDQANPVTRTKASSNPLRELLHAEFPSEVEVSRAIEDFNE